MSTEAFLRLIEVKRDGGTHSAQDLDRLILGYTNGEVPDYQMSAWLMAALLNGLDAEETVAMTDAMVRSGRIIDLSAVPGVKVDKHSTGGVADTTTLVLAPLVAACGAPVAKMSGRGLGHTGGTLDKLESIPGFRTDLSVDRFIRQVTDIGVAVVAQSDDVDPADRAIYALRDVTGTVPSVPLIVGSIISKKVAGGADAILLDVKVGSGAFMKTVPQAKELADELTRVGRALGKNVDCVISGMEQPLGMAVGNAVEVREAIATLRGEGPDRLAELCVVLAGKMLVMSGVAVTEEHGRSLAEEALENGSALDRFSAWVEAQGGDPRVCEDLTLLPLANMTRELRAVESGHVLSMDAEAIGRAAALLGAGRLRKGDDLDPGAGIVLRVRIGDRVSRGDSLATLMASSEQRLEEGERAMAGTIRIGEGTVSHAPLLLEA